MLGQQVPESCEIKYAVFSLSQGICVMFCCVCMCVRLRVHS